MSRVSVAMQSGLSFTRVFRSHAWSAYLATPPDSITRRIGVVYGARDRIVDSLLKDIDSI